MADAAIERFSFHTDPADLNELELRLKRTRWPDEVVAEPWRYGPPVAYMKSFVQHWLDRYDWRTHEAHLNFFPQFVTQIDQHRVHFIHQAGRGPAPIPLVLTHGWPGSFVEMLKIIPLLTDPASHGGDPADAFTVIAPSIPGYGFSSRPKERGTSVFAVADIWAKLMTRLNYPKFESRAATGAPGSAPRPRFSIPIGCSVFTSTMCPRASGRR
jgi:Epoxide hydrolase N terminus